ncbi:MAG: hypothetical protein JNL01_13080 [Bdellovibrionales bacterium]|nr:hypothetical protein [Bdellovibrionales bacterium]
MRWNCPHCGTALSVADDKLSNTWSFSKCFQCSGYALVRKSDLNLIKVDDAPKGEKLVRPQADISAPSETRITRPEQITAIIEKKPASNAPVLAEAIVREKTEAPVTVQIPVQRSEFDSIVLEPVGGYVAPARFNPPSRPQALTPKAPAPVVTKQEPAFTSTFNQELKWVLPEQPGENSDPEGTDRPSRSEFRTSFTQRKPIFSRAKLIPLSVGFAAAIAIGSGLMMVQESSKLSKRRARSQATAQQMMSTLQIPASMRAVPQAGTVPNAISDTVKEKAMAPSRVEAQSPVQAPVPATATATASVPTPVTAQKAASAVNDSVAALVVQIKVPQATLRSGPGLTFGITGKAKLSSNFVVKDWRGEWFRIILPEESSGLRDILRGEPRTAWIRNDLVRLVTLDQ